MALEQVEVAFDPGGKQRLIRGLLIAARKELVEYKTRTLSNLCRALKRSGSRL